MLSSSPLYADAADTWLLGGLSAGAGVSLEEVFVLSSHPCVVLRIRRELPDTDFERYISAHGLPFSLSLSCPVHSSCRTAEAAQLYIAWARKWAGACSDLGHKY